MPWPNDFAQMLIEAFSLTHDMHVGMAVILAVVAWISLFAVAPAVTITLLVGTWYERKSRRGGR